MLWFVALLLGWLLVEGQPSAGGSWSNPYFLSLETAHFSWGLLLVGLAACLWGAGKRALGWGFVLLVGLGAWLPTFLLDAPYFRVGPWMASSLMVLMGIALHFQKSESPESAETTPQPRWILILTLGGAGMAFGLHGLALILSRMSDSGPGSTSVSLATFAVLMGLGAFAFGRPLPADPKKRGKFLAFVWITLLFGVFAAMRAEETLGTDRGLRSLLRRFGLDSSWAGTTPGELLTSVSVLILPAFSVGTLVLVLRHARWVAMVALGAALGTFLVPTVLSSGAAESSGLQPSLRLVLIGMIVILGTAGCVWLGQKRRLVGALTVLTCIPFALAHGRIMPNEAILAPKPWQRTQVDPVWQMETPQGQLSVSADGMGGYQARLDQMPLTADAEHARLHNRCMALSMGWRKSYSNPAHDRVLLIGVLTPQISHRLRSLGAARIDRLTPFGEAVTRSCEKALAGGKEVPENLGDRIDAQVAEARIRDGVYSLVLGLPVQRTSARPPRGLPASATATGAIWSSLEGLQATHYSDQKGVICSDGLGRFAFAWGQDGNSVATESFGSSLATLGRGGRTISRWNWGLLRPWDRTPLAVACSLDSLAQGASANDARLFETLRDLSDSQTHSSPFETEFERIELPPELVSDLVQALIAGPDSGFYREIAGGLARTLVGKRDVGAIMEFLPPLSEALGRPYELERSLARAELESLEPAAAATRLQRLRGAWPQQDGYLEDLAIALDQSEQAELAVEVWEILRGIHTGEWHFEKAWTLSLVRAGDPRAPAALESALASHPEDPDLLGVSQSGPLPPVQKGFRPEDGRHEGHDHD